LILPYPGKAILITSWINLVWPVMQLGWLSPICHRNHLVIYFSYFHSIMSYGIIFWGNSSISNNIFRLQEGVVRIITNIRSRDSCKEQFKKLQILPLQSQYILSLLLFVINSNDMFEHNCAIHTINTRNRTNLHLPHLRQ
jgi:hypothetical protein